MKGAAAGTNGELFARNGWKLKQPDSPLLLADVQLLEHRDPAERWMLALAIGAIAIFAISLWYRERDILAGVAAVYLSMLVTALQAKTYYRMQGAEVTATQFPAIFAIAQELQQRFQAPATRIFVLRKPSFKTEAFGLRAPYVIVLPAVLIDAIERDELRYVLGQALGHTASDIRG